MSKFQMALLGILVVAAIGGILVFSYSSRTNQSNSAPVVVWGEVDQSLFALYLDRFRTESQIDLKIIYVEKRPEIFEKELVEALASGRGPDAILLSQDLILKHKDKVYPIPFGTFSERQFKDTFIQEAELYLTSEGILAMPFSVDPMILFWNRDMFSTAGVANPPQYWDELYALGEIFTKKDDASNILQSTLALGEYGNVTHAKDIISILMIQAGTSIVGRSPELGYVSQLENFYNFTVRPSDAAVTFYTQFANPLRQAYSWNRSLPASKDYFIAGDSAMYIGYASEIPEIRQKNPNLNYDVAPLLQARNTKTKLTFATLKGFAVLKQTPDVTNTFNAITSLTGQNGQKYWSEAVLLPPIRRDLLADKPTGAIGAVIFDSALWSRGWLDPDRVETNRIFKEMIENVTSGKATVSEATTRAHDLMTIVLKKINDLQRVSI
jgi:ABC-type glycerol-3-phosphate transport system substrate-binding protein